MNGIPSSIAAIQQATAKHFGVGVHDILSDRRSRQETWPRHVAMYLAKQLTSHSLPVIGRHFGKRDHTTVMYAIRKVEERMERSGQDREAVEELRGTLGPLAERRRPARGPRRLVLDEMAALLARRRILVDELDAVDKKLDEYGYGIWGSDDQGSASANS